MAEAALNFDESTLDKSSDLYHLYDRLYQGMQKANEVDAPAFPSADDLLVKDRDGNATFDADGNPVIDADKSAQIDKIASDYSGIMLKNSAYLFANSIMSVLSGGDGSDGNSSSGYVSRAGDTMKGALSALYGFEAGVKGQKIIEVSIDADDVKWLIVDGRLRVKDDAEFDGLIKLGKGISFDGSKAIYLDNNTLVIERPAIALKGDVSVDGTFTLGDVVINKDGIFWDKYEFYHSGNSNKVDVDWTMKNGNVYGNLSVKQDASIDGKLTAIAGFTFGVLQKSLLYSEIATSIGGDGSVANTPQVVMDSDLRIINGHGIKFGNSYIVYPRNNSVVSFSAPGMIMNLGDSDNGKQTNKISLQSDIWDYSNSFKIITKEGAGFFPNGLKANCSVNGSSVLETYRVDNDDLGVLFNKLIRLGSLDGPAIFQEPSTGEFTIQMSYANVQVDGTPKEKLQLRTYFAQTDSLFRDMSLPWSATLHFNSDGEFFAFDKPVESEYFAIKNSRYKTRLIEDALFFDDGKFIEGVVNGLRYSGNGYFDGDISSPSFASGFAGYGWAVKDEITNGGFHATFDTLTVRKKMRLYELEVQKNSCTNGSLWVSDFCSGDEVIALD